MADIKVRAPWPVVSDPTATALVRLSDNGDGTHSPVVSLGGTIFSTAATTPGSTFVTHIRQDSRTNGGLYVWDGTQYVKVANPPT